MKTKAACLLVAISFITTLSMGQKNITVEAQNSDISNNLDLKAVATAFGESSNLEEFEKRLNDYDSQISNLDLNNDGQVDYLRVIEKNDNGVHVVEIQAVLGKDVYQDVASIIVEKDQNNNPTVQVVGDPYVYGDNYIIDPAYAYDASIFSFFWGANYFGWNSPYYWGYYPSYYHRHSPYALDMYYSHVYSQINHNQRYYYTNSIRNSAAASLISSVRRNDLGVRQPDRSFTNRNVNARNKRDFEFSRNGANNQIRPSYQSNSTGSKSVRAYDNNGNRNQGYQNATRTTNPSSYIRTNTENRNTNTRTYTTPVNGQQNSSSYRGQNGNYQTRPTYNTNGQTRPSIYQYRTPNTMTRGNYNSSRQNQAGSQPNRGNVQRQQVQRQQVQHQQNVSAPRQSAPQRSESNSSNSNRR